MEPLAVRVRSIRGAVRRSSIHGGGQRRSYRHLLTSSPWSAPDHVRHPGRVRHWKPTLLLDDVDDLQALSLFQLAHGHGERLLGLHDCDAGYDVSDDSIARSLHVGNVATLGKMPLETQAENL